MPATKTAARKPATSKTAAKKPAAKSAGKKSTASSSSREPKTKHNDASVEAFLKKQNAARLADCRTLDALFRKVTGEEPRMYGSSIVGYGNYHYVYESGREGDAPVAAFSPRAQALTLYVMDEFEGRDALLSKLGKHTTGKVCLYVKRLEDIDLKVLETMLRKSVAAVRKRYP